MGGDDYRFGPLPRSSDDPLLDQRHLFQRKLHSQITTGHHEGVEGVDNVVEVLDRLRFLDFGDHRDPASLLVHHAMHIADVETTADEGQGHQVDPVA